MTPTTSTPLANLINYSPLIAPRTLFVFSKKEITYMFLCCSCFRKPHFMFHHPRSVFQEHDDVMGIMCFSCVHMGLICQILRSNPPTSLLCTTPRITSAFICLPKVVCVSPCLSLQQFSWDFICRWSEKNTLKFTRITKHSWSVRKWTRDTEEKEMTGNGGKGNVISVLVSKYFCCV